MEIKNFSNTHKKENLRALIGFGWLEISLIVGAFIYISWSDFNWNIGKLTISSVPIVVSGYPNHLDYLEIEDEVVKKFIENFGHLAKIHERQYGIPAELKLAAAILESKAGIRDSYSLEGVHFLLGTNPRQKSVYKNWQKHSEFIHKGFRKSGFNSDQKEDWEKYFQIVYSKGGQKKFSNLIDGIVKLYGLEKLDKYLALN